MATPALKPAHVVDAALAQGLDLWDAAGVCARLRRDVTDEDAVAEVAEALLAGRHAMPLVDYLEHGAEGCLTALFREIAAPAWVEAMGERRLRETLFAAEGLRWVLQTLKPELICLPAPRCAMVFEAFSGMAFPPAVTILGQNPYPDVSHACGMAFSTANGEVSKSLETVVKAHTPPDDEAGRPGPGPRLTLTSGNLTPWRDQGVFLFNAALTTMKGVRNNNHSDAWKHFAALTLEVMLKSKAPIAFCVWGRDAKDVFYRARDSVARTVAEAHDVTFAPHPSPMAGAAFLREGHNCLFRAGAFALRNGRVSTPIVWDT